MRLGVVNSLGLPVSDMGDDILSWPGKRGVLKLGESRTRKEWQEIRKSGESALRYSHEVVDSGDGDIQWNIMTLT